MPQSEMTAPVAGLRPPGVRLLNKSNGPAKVAISVAAGSGLEVDADVAGQLLRQSQAFTVDNDPSGGGVVEEETGDVPAAVPGPPVKRGRKAGV